MPGRASSTSRGAALRLTKPVPATVTNGETLANSSGVMPRTSSSSGTERSGPLRGRVALARGVRQESLRVPPGIGIRRGRLPEQAFQARAAGLQPGPRRPGRLGALGGVQCHHPAVARGEAQLAPHAGGHHPQPERRDQRKAALALHLPPLTATVSGSPRSGGRVSPAALVRWTSTPRGSTLLEIQLGNQRSPPRRLERERTRSEEG